MKKLDARGVGHDILIVAFVAVFAIAGVGYLVASHADAGDGRNALRATAPKYLKCKNISSKGVTPGASSADNDKLFKLNDYFKYQAANTTPAVDTSKDHSYTLNRLDYVQGVHYCWQDSPGYAYPNYAIGRTALKAYKDANGHNAPVVAEDNAIKSHNLVPDSYGTIAYISNAPHGKYTAPLYRYYSPQVGSFYLTTKPDQSMEKPAKSLSKAGYVPDSVDAAGKLVPIGYIWTRANVPINY